MSLLDYLEQLAVAGPVVPGDPGISPGGDSTGANGGGVTIGAYGAGGHVSPGSVTQAGYSGDAQPVSWNPLTWPAEFWKGFQQNVTGPLAAEAPYLGVYLLVVLLFLIGVTMLFFSSSFGSAIRGGAAGEVNAIGREKGRALVRPEKAES